MELKLIGAGINAHSQQSFTRTFMELKHYWSSLFWHCCIVLLVPLWNWNVEYIDLMYLLYSEFYSYLYGIETGLRIGLLVLSLMFYSYLYGIETLNVLYCCSETYEFYSYLYGIETSVRPTWLFNKSVLLVPLWNWNLVKTITRQKTNYCFTRTFMELKLSRRISRRISRLFYSYLYGIETKFSVLAYISQSWFYSYLYGIETTEQELMY